MLAPLTEKVGAREPGKARREGRSQCDHRCSVSSSRSRTHRPSRAIRLGAAYLIAHGGDPALNDVARDLRLHLYDAAELALIAEVTPDAGARPRVQHVGGELFVGVERRLAFATYAAVTQDDALLWEAQQRVTFKQLIAAGITKAEIGKHVARDGTCWIFFADLAAAVLVDAETRSTIIDPSRFPL